MIFVVEKSTSEELKFEADFFEIGYNQELELFKNSYDNSKPQVIAAFGKDIWANVYNEKELIKDIKENEKSSKDSN